MTPEQSAAVERLKKALEAGPTDGPWEFGSYANGQIRPGPQGNSKHSAFATMAGRADIPWDASDESRQAFNDAEYIAAANPDTIRTLLAALDEAQQDAARYQWLRSRVPGGTYRIMGVIYSEGGCGVDAAIDAARAWSAA